MKPVLSLLMPALLLLACNNKPLPASQFDEQLYLQKGDSIAAVTQGMLLTNVTKAMQSKGVAGAVDFCSEKAMPLTDSASGIFAVSIQRLSDKNRNPRNAIQTHTDTIAWLQLKEMMQDTLQPKKHLVMQETDTGIYYYKAITIAMPGCLKCHGIKETDIASETLKIINEKYPADKAAGYRAGDLRGMWKITMSESR